MTAVKGGVTTTYKYGADGLRTQKKVGSTTYNYYYADGLLIRQTWGTNYMDFLYDESGNAYSFVYNGTQYYYVRNLQGDVVKILNTSGSVVASYSYDAWGKVTNSGNVVGQYNPIRYRGYYYDTDTGFYYLQSRYYDPVIKRFISADDASLLGVNGDFTSLNLYAYCGNNPITRVDSRGSFWNTIIGGVVGAIVGGVSAAITGSNIKAGIVSGAISGVISGAAVDIAIATGGVGLVAFAGVTIASGAGGATSSYINQRMNGKSHNEVDYETVIVDGVWGAIGGMLSFGTADIGGKTCKTLMENLALKGKAFLNQVGSDVATTFTITIGTWLNGTKMNSLRE